MNLIYLMGAGRSGTTIFATVLGGSKNITTLGEMHQFLDHLLEDKPCSCGQSLKECSFWAPIISKLETLYSKEELLQINKRNKTIENHSHISKSYHNNDMEYGRFQKDIFAIISEKNPSKYHLDSAKFISRGLQLNKIEGINLKFIYIIRDVRGVIHSFNKKVQTTKKPLSAIVYYATINFFGQWIYWLLGKEKVLKLRYEDFVNDTEKVLLKVQDFIGCDLSENLKKLDHNEPFDMPHIIGGNRMTESKRVTLKSDLQWKKSISRPKQIAYYMLTLPFMLINKYKA